MGAANQNFEGTVDAEIMLGFVKSRWICGCGVPALKNHDCARIKSFLKKRAERNLCSAGIFDSSLLDQRGS